jgi:adenylate cyclase
MRAHREAMVAISGATASASSTKTVLAGGSSSVFSSAGVATSTRCTSWTMTTLRAPSTGLRVASRTMASASSTRRAAPAGANERTSGCSPARARRQSRQVPSPPDGHSSAALKPRAAAAAPAPGGPTSR